MFRQVVDFPGGKVAFIAEMEFLAELSKERINCYRVLDDDGQTISGSSFKEVFQTPNYPMNEREWIPSRIQSIWNSEVRLSRCQVSKEMALEMYSGMVTLQTMDTIFYEAQRQGRISFYLTTIGEEAINIASAAALTMDDVVFPQVETGSDHCIASFGIFWSLGNHLDGENSARMSSTGNPASSSGEVSPCRNSPTSVSATNTTTAKGGRCRSIMVPTSLITSRFLHPLRM